MQIDHRLWQNLIGWAWESLKSQTLVTETLVCQQKYGMYNGRAPHRSGEICLKETDWRPVQSK